jgi:hypothetical protein
MPTFLSDPPQSVYAILAAAVLVAGLVWFNRRSRRSLAVFLGVLLFLAAVVLFDRLFESSREEAVRRVQAMVRAADAKDNEAFVTHLADKVESRGSGLALSLSREFLRQSPFWTLLRHNDAHVAAWDFSRADVTEIDANTVEIGFMAKGEGRGKIFPVYFRAKFARQPDGQMKMTEFRSFDPVRRTNEPIDLSNYLK